jgi:hypothetical protein
MLCSKGRAGSSPALGTNVRGLDRPYRAVGAWIVVEGLVTQPWRATVRPRTDTPITSTTARQSTTAKVRFTTNRGAIFTALTIMGTP